ncbi:toll/interleukin-1 receptor domain-containing protein [Mycobacterium sp. OTB74]|jgi:hypothetical protein|uniref:toll/interleukin-1 receptor domain-containing protein n=1 Tax=Mycobacterium sp. OTB74 TaxID=1853452 RepID=UPI0024756781|nr:toll/interleukin-1 receptor domain-containing protein [Mycobacterium sp. OTB74]MDH6247466.1 hypothetical protein [Mycobacterium sp. OTB74]
MDEDFWDDLLSHIRQQVLVPVIGPDLAIVNVGGAERTLTTVIGQRVAEHFHLDVPPGDIATGEAVEAYLRERGADEAERLYRVINDIIIELDPLPGDGLRDLAAIDDLRFLVSTTPDQLLARAINEVRFNGRPGVRQLAFSLNQSTNQQALNAREPTTDTVVLNLFGQASSTPQYAIHDEDRLEWMHSLVSDTASLPDWIAHRLKHQPILFIGCEIPDWLGRFLLRMSSETRLSLERSQFFFAGCTSSREPSLSNFFGTYCRRGLVEQTDMDPVEFVAQLRSRWEARRTPKCRPMAHATAQLESGDPKVFISYMREDIDAARRLRNAICDLGGEVWFDEDGIRPGDKWEQEVWTQIRGARLFIAVISANMKDVDEGFVYNEWNQALKRSRSIVGRSFIVPVVIDEDYNGDPNSYPNLLPGFHDLDFGWAPGGDPDDGLKAMLTSAIRDAYRTGAA